MNLTGCFDLAEAASLAALIGSHAQTISATWRHGSAQPTPQPMRSNIATLNTVSLPANCAPVYVIHGGFASSLLSQNKQVCPVARRQIEPAFAHPNRLASLISERKGLSGLKRAPHRVAG